MEKLKTKPLSSPVSVKAVRWKEWENSIEKSDQDSVDGMRQEVHSKGKEMHNEMSGQWFFKEEDDDGRERVTEEEERVSIWGESTEIIFQR